MKSTTRSSRSQGVPALLAADTSVPLVECTVGELLALRASQYPGDEAVLGIRHDGNTVRLCYGELYDEAGRVAGALVRLTEPGSHVALWAPNIVEWTVIQYGAALAGMVLVALNPVLREDELHYALRHSDATILLHADRSRDYAMGEVAERVCAQLSRVRRISLSQSDVWRADEAVEPTRTPRDPGSAVMLQYTSGTTGRPKGVVLTHRALVNVAKLTMEAAGVERGAVCFNPLPLFHTAGCVIATLGPLWVAGAVIINDRFEPEVALETMRHEGVSVFFYVPTVLGALLEKQEVASDSAPTLDVVMGGAATVSPDLIDRVASVFAARVLNLFGQTELAPVLTMTRPGDTREDRLATVGRPLPQVDCKIIDPHSGQTVTIGEVGEICARGYQQFLCYLNDPEATERALDSEGFVRTGDLGSIDGRGYLTVTGRLKELIIRGGENIAPAEVERVIAGHPDVVEVVAIGLPDDRWGEVVGVACRVSDPDRPGVKDELDAFARAQLPAYKVPARWFVVEQFPVTPTGKVQRFALRARILERSVREL